MDSTVCFSHAELFEVSVEDGLVGAADTTIASGKSVLEERLDGIDQTIATARSEPSTADGTMGMTKMWDSSDSDPI